MKRDWIITLTCATCRDTKNIRFDTKREMREYTYPTPYYCPKHDPNRLHGDDLINFCKSILGVTWFDLHYFRKMRSYSQNVVTVKYFEADCTVTFYQEEQTTEVNWTRVYSCSLFDGEGSGWRSPETLRDLRPITNEERQEIIDICQHEKEHGYFGNFGRNRAIAGYTRIMNSVASIENLMVIS